MKYLNALYILALISLTSASPSLAGRSHEDEWVSNKMKKTQVVKKSRKKMREEEAAKWVEQEFDADKFKEEELPTKKLAQQKLGRRATRTEHEVAQGSSEVLGVQYGISQALQEAGEYFPDAVRYGMFAYQRKQDELAKSYFLRGAKGLDGEAMLALLLMAKDQRGISGDFFVGELNDLYERAVEERNPVAVRNLGILFEMGWGRPVDIAQAVRLYTEAADAGNVLAISRLGLIYLRGEGPDGVQLLRAQSLLTRAADLGDLEVQEYLGILLYQGTLLTQDWVEARRLFEMAAARGSVLAMNSLGLMCQYGQGGTIDFTRARSLFSQAADRRSMEGFVNLRCLKQALGDHALDE